MADNHTAVHYAYIGTAGCISLVFIVRVYSTKAICFNLFVLLAFIDTILSFQVIFQAH